jgi:hypothetical protein
MKLIKTIITKTALKEDAAGGSVGAGAIGMCAMPLFSTLVKRSSPVIKVIKWNKAKPAKKKPSIGLKEAFDALYELDVGGSGGMNMSMDGKPKAASTDSSFDPTSIMAKLKGLETKDKEDHRNTVSFGLEDDNGGIVRVTVSSEQAEDFEKSLQAFMAQAEREDDAVPEIAEVLFKLKDRFDIIDVQWPEVHEDEEEDVSLKGGEEGGEQAGGDINLGDEPADQSTEPPASGGAGDGQVKDLLVQVIDMMKADAEARKAEARAKEAEAKAKEADTIVKQTMSKVKQEEQFLDMETFNKSRKEEDRETKRLAALAKWKHQMSKEQGITDDDQDVGDDTEQSLSAPQNQAPDLLSPGIKQGGREEEERTMRKPIPMKPQMAQQKQVIKGRVHPHDLASFILSRVK